MILESITFEGSLEYVRNRCCRTMWFAWLPLPTALDLGLWWLQTLCAFPSAFFFPRVSPASQTLLLPAEQLLRLLRWPEARLKPWGSVSHPEPQPCWVFFCSQRGWNVTPWAREVWFSEQPLRVWMIHPRSAGESISCELKPWLRGNRK